MGHSVNLKRKVDDQTIVDNCKISRTKIGSVESVNGQLSKIVGCNSETNTCSNSLKLLEFRLVMYTSKLNCKLMGWKAKSMSKWI